MQSKKDSTKHPTKYSIFQNLNYAVRKLVFYEGKGFYFYAFFQIVLEVMRAFLIMALPSTVISLMNSDKSEGNILILALGYVLMVHSTNNLVTFLSRKTGSITFLFRIDIMKEFIEKTIDMDYMKMESDEGKKEQEKALNVLYSGNEFGIEALINKAIIFIINVLGFIVYASISVSLSGWILSVLIVTSIIIIVANEWKRTVIKKNRDKYIEYDKKITYMANQTIDSKNGKDIRLYSMKSWFMDSFGMMNNKYLLLYENQVKKYYIVKIVERCANLFRDGFVYAYLINKMINGMELEYFLLYLGITAGFSIWMGKAFESLNGMHIDSDMVNDYRYFMEHSDKSTGSHTEKIVEKCAHEIKLKNVSFSYPGSEDMVLKNVNLTIKSGEKLGLVGVNGAGKSTLVKLICGLYTPTDGTIYLDGIDISTISKAEYFKEISVVFQDVFAFAFSIEENIACIPPNKINNKKLIHSLKQSGLYERVEALDKNRKTTMLKDLDEEGIVFSGGEMQKLMLARALYKDSNVIILDEPTAALDPIAESAMYEKYNQFAKDKTSIFISHRLSSTRFCDRLIFLQEGRIVEEGSHQELMDKMGEYANMFTIQSHYYQKDIANKVEVGA